MQTSFTQSWLSETEPGFHPGTAQIILIGKKLHFQAELIQPKTFTGATAHQQRLWELGDVVELFLHRIGYSDYHEYQIAPNGLMLALHYPDREAVTAVRIGERQMEEFLSDLPIEGKTAITSTGWNASLAVPVTGQTFRFNFGRYDYSNGISPIVSSTSKLTKRDFHRLEEWNLFN